ncbi:MAG: hypothetical protein JO020_24180 [Chloroflexi bacterium]|nr:hypothetical protein [Chloroflexota bacterium]
MFDWLAAVEAALADADAQLVTELGGRTEVTVARLWRGQVLVDWQPDPNAGDCLLRTDLLQKLVVRGAVVAQARNEVVLRAPGRVIASVSERHASLVKRLGGARRVSLRVRLRFDQDRYIGGDETYEVRSSALMRLTANVRLRQASTASLRTSPAPT